MQYIQRAREVLDVEIAGLQCVRDGLGPEFSRSVKVLLDRLNGGGKIVVTGIGKNLHIGRKMAATLTSTGAPAVVLHPLEALHGDLGILDDRDIVLAMSFSGETTELLNLLPLIKRRSVPIIAMTGNPRSTLGEAADELLLVRVEREACPFNMAPTASTTATLALGDALAIVLLEARGFGREDYARLHPGGAIGRTLLLRVRDIMRSGNRLARVGPEERVHDAILAMTGARSGSVAVTDPEGRVLGIFTDGDLRRRVGEDPRVTERPVREVMTPQAVTLRDDQLAIEALAVFEQHKVDDLLVVDAEGRLTGLVDLQDLPRMKIL